MAPDPKRILVKRLPSHFDDVRLSKFFSKRVGTVESAWVAIDRNTGLGTGIGFVTFAKKDLARKAVESPVFANGTMLEVHEDGAKENSTATNPKCELRVKGLPWDVTDELLYKQFQDSVGQVKSAKVAVDRNTGQLRDIGFLTFSTKAAAKAARQQPHFINGKMLDVQKSGQEYNAGEEDLSERKLFVKGIPLEFTDEDLHKYFTQRGSKVTLIRVAMDRDSGESRGFGHVTFENAGSAQDAMAQAHFVNGKALTMRWSDGDTGGQDANDSERTLFVRGFSTEVSDEELFKYFAAKYTNKVETARVATDWETGESRGFGHVIFHEESDAHSATLIPHFMNEKLLEVRAADAKGKGKGKGHGKDSEGRSIYVGRIPLEVTDEELYEYFKGRYANKVESARVVKDRETGEARGFGFVTFNTEANAEAASNNLHFVRRMSLDVRLSGDARDTWTWAPEMDKNLRTLEVRGLDPDCQDEDLFDHFSQYSARIESAKVIAHKWMGIVVLAKSDDAKAVTRRQHSILGSAVNVECDCDADRRLIVTGFDDDGKFRRLPKEFDDAGLHKYFTRCVGPVQSARIVKNDNTGESRGFGIVVLRKLDAIEDALGMIHTIDGDRGLVPVEVSLDDGSKGKGKGKDKGKGKGKGKGKWKDTYEDDNDSNWSTGTKVKKGSKDKRKGVSIDLSFRSAKRAREACVVLSRLELSAKVDPEDDCQVLVTDPGMSREELASIFAPAESNADLGEEVHEVEEEAWDDGEMPAVDTECEAEEDDWEEDVEDVPAASQDDEAWSEDEEWQEEELTEESPRKRKSESLAEAIPKKRAKAHLQPSVNTSSEDWIEMVSVTKGSVYYYNTKTGESKFNLP